jgi:uncharacterized circularly permuted ATP-grasp superfamily protein/uncharacterized alpha-E superfamily protein
MSERPSHSLAAPQEGLLEHYSAAPGVFDELAGFPGQLRLHWQPLMGALERLGRHELASRWESARRMLRAHGVTYNTYGDPQGLDRPWDLDLVPLVLGADEWARLEAGLVQRARLFNVILADIYSGSQRLLRDGFLPPEIIYDNPGFLRACRGVPVKSQVYVHLLACDLGRSPDGQWWVLADRTQSPSGTGYAWENRTVISRVLPREIRDAKVQRLGGFFRRQREMLLRLAPPGRHHPNVVLLTPGPHNDAYFEHAYLARHLGFTLVEGADLTVRNRRVFVRTVEGLQPVELIVRRVNDAACDPLELGGGSFLGVPGLVEACRAGNVTVANALGAGLLESPALLAFLPGLCRHLLAEELLLPSVATWWCGQAEPQRYVLEHIDKLLLKAAFVSAGPTPLPEPPQGRARSAEPHARLIELLQASPGRFVGQERVKLSQVPVWTEGRLSSRALVLRAFVASDGESFAVLPGGLARVSKNSQHLARAMQSGDGSKDTWILGNAPARPEPVQPPRESAQAERLPAGVPSRAADHLFWLGRYTERLAQLLRLIRCILGRASEENSSDGPLDLKELAELTAYLGVSPSGPDEKIKSGEFSDRLLRLVYRSEEGGGVRELLGRIRFIAANVRDRFSADMWRILGRLEADGRARPGRLPLASATTLIHQLVLDLAAFEGMEMENMTRGSGWRFLDLGRRLERGLTILRLLAAAAKVRSHSAAILEPVLEIADSVMTYRRLHFTAPAWSGVLQLLLRDETNPRSLAFQLVALGEHIRLMAAELKTAVPALEQTLISSLADELRTADFHQLAAQRTQGVDRRLSEVLNGWASNLSTFSDEVTRRYFSLTAPRVS